MASSFEVLGPLTWSGEVAALVAPYPLAPLVELDLSIEKAKAKTPRGGLEVASLRRTVAGREHVLKTPMGSNDKVRTSQIPGNQKRACRKVVIKPFGTKNESTEIGLFASVLSPEMSADHMFAALVYSQGQAVRI